MLGAGGCGGVPRPREWKGEFGEPVGWIRDALGFRAEEAAGEGEIGGATRNGAPIFFAKLRRDPPR